MNQSTHATDRPSFAQRLRRGLARWRFLVIEAVLSAALLAAWLAGIYALAIALGAFLIAVVVADLFGGGVGARPSVGAERPSEVRIRG